jgi:hypothetical protein
VPAPPERKERQQQVGQQQGCEMVHLQAELVAIGADLAPLSAVRSGAYAGVVDEDVETVVSGRNLLGQAMHVAKRREICDVCLQPIVARCGSDLATRRCRALGVTTVQQNTGSTAGELPCRSLADAVGRTGDENDLLAQRRASSAFSRLRNPGEQRRRNCRKFLIQ